MSQYFIRRGASAVKSIGLDRGLFDVDAALVFVQYEVSDSPSAIMSASLMTKKIRMRSSDLIEKLREARQIELALFTDLGDDQLRGPKAHSLEPPIWEVGHVGWFQEYWLLRHLDGAKPILENGDSIYDSVNVSYRLRWDHNFPSREETLSYLRTVLDRCVRRLEGREPSEEEVYFYRHIAQHESMHS